MHSTNPYPAGSAEYDRYDAELVELVARAVPLGPNLEQLGLTPIDASFVPVEDDAGLMRPLLVVCARLCE